MTAPANPVDGVLPHHVLGPHIFFLIHRAFNNLEDPNRFMKFRPGRSHPGKVFLNSLRGINRPSHIKARVFQCQDVNLIHHHKKSNQIIIQNNRRFIYINNQNKMIRYHFDLGSLSLLKMALFGRLSGIYIEVKSKANS